MKRFLLGWFAGFLLLFSIGSILALIAPSVLITLASCLDVAFVIGFFGYLFKVGISMLHEDLKYRSKNWFSRDEIPPYGKARSNQW